MVDDEKRIMRIILPVRLIREMDSVISSGAGGYATRSEFIIDAIQERILETSIRADEESGAPAANSRSMSNLSLFPSPQAQVDGKATAIASPSRGFAVLPSDNRSSPEGRALLGLHNRDYPSIWALARLAAIAAENPVPIEDYFALVTREAWEFGELLIAMEKRSGTKRTALFPTNAQKRRSAEAAFRTFAIGDYRASSAGAYITSGPLFEWRAVGICTDPQGRTQIGMTDSGWTLLAALDSLTIDEPHPEPASIRFFAHLSQHAPADRAGFYEVIRAIGRDGASRQDVHSHLARVWPSWTPNEVSTNSAGYIARAREWGLVEPKQTSSRYNLTTFGLGFANGDI